MTKRIIALVFFLGTAQMGTAQGIDFEHSNWTRVVAKAKAENKLIFMDAYTSWCKPCKLMQKRVFPDKTLGDYFNANFISTKVNMEKGEGFTLARKYKISAYPTLLFIDPNSQKVVKGVLGYRDSATLLEIAKKSNAKGSK